MKVRINKKEIFFISSYIIFIVTSLIQMSLFYKYIMGILYFVLIGICMSLILLSELVTSSFDIKRIMGIMVMLLLLSIVIKSNNGLSAMIYLIIYTYAARQVSIDKIVDVTIKVSSWVSCIIVCSSLIGIIQDYIVYTVDNRTRHFLGFRYALYAPKIFFNITALLVYKYKQYIKGCLILVLMLLNFILYTLSQSRLSFGLTMLLLISAFFLKKNALKIEKQKLLQRLMIVSYPCCMLISIWLTVRYSNANSVMVVLDEFLGGRLAMGKLSLNKYGFGLFGTKITLIGNSIDAYGQRSKEQYFYIDNFYIQILQHFGLVFTVLFLGLLTYAMIKCSREHNIYLLVILTYIAVHGIVDDLNIFLAFNSFWLPVGMLLMENGTKKKGLILNGPIKMA